MLPRYRPSRLCHLATALGLLIPAMASAAANDPPVPAEPPAATAPAPPPAAHGPDEPANPDAATPQAPLQNPTESVPRETLEAGSAFRTLGQDIKGPSGIVVGQLVNILVNAEGQPVAAVLDYGGFLGVGKRRIAVAWRALRFGPEGIGLSLSREQLRGVPDFKEGEPAVIAAPVSSPATETSPNR